MSAGIERQLDSIADLAATATRTKDRIVGLAAPLADAPAEISGPLLRAIGFAVELENALGLLQDAATSEAGQERT